MPKKKIEKIDTDTQDIESVDDVVLEEEGLGVLDKLKKVQKKLKECEKERAEYLDGWQRARADLVNREKEAVVVRTELTSRAQEEVFEQLFPILDSFDMAFANKDVWESVDKNWRVGVEHIYSQALQVLKDAGISVIDNAGEVNDPAIHEAVKTQEVAEEKDDGRVLAVLQKGYRKGERVLRPAKVIIGKNK
ncbi:MAG: nucleotide exchange factor GrpE [Candidatus Pacebacteria bacterium]|nr:nucleotide exchange factor GrpE [Candidatus Paceibacterota bacterium]